MVSELSVAKESLTPAAHLPLWLCIGFLVGTNDHMKLTDRGCTVNLKKHLFFRVVDVSFSSLSKRVRADQ